MSHSAKELIRFCLSLKKGLNYGDPTNIVADLMLILVMLFVSSVYPLSNYQKVSMRDTLIIYSLLI